MAHKILIPLDLDHHAVFDSVFSEAIAYANVHDSSIILLTVVPQLMLGYLPSVEAKYMRKLIAETKVKLEKLGRQRLGSGFSWEVKVVAGKSPAGEIIRIADDDAVDLVVMASHNPQFSDIVFGSVADRVVRHAHHSVHIVRQPRKSLDKDEAIAESG